MDSDQNESWLPPKRPGHSERWRLANGTDIEQTLQAAERLLGQAREEERHLRYLYGALAVALTVALASLAGLAVAAGDSGFRSTGALLVLVAVSSIVISGFMMLQVSARRNASRSARSGRVAADLAAMVEVAYLEVSEREQWSYLRLQATKRRLAAFSLHERAQET